MRVVLIKGASAYDATRVFTDELADAFAARGFEAQVLDLAGRSDWRSALGAAAAADRRPTALVHSFAFCGGHYDGRSIGDMFDAPHVLQLVDYPLTHADALSATDPGTALLVVDPTHVQAVGSAFGAGRFAHVGFCPHGGVRPSESAPESLEAYAGRPIPILFTGTFYKPDTPAWRELDAGAQRLFDDALDLSLGAEFLPAVSALDQVLAVRGIEPEGEGARAIRRHAHLVHEHVRRHRRFEFLKAAAKAGLPLHLYGRGYDAQMYRFRRMTHGGEVTLAEATRLMTQARVVVNLNAHFGAGSHERPFTAMLAGAAAVSDHSSFYAGAFEAGVDLQLFRWRALAEGVAALGALAADPARAWDMARAGRAKALAGHAWASRIDTIVAAADAARPRLAEAA